jgi:hypothetical protein
MKDKGYCGRKLAYLIAWPLCPNGLLLLMKDVRGKDVEGGIEKNDVSFYAW